MQALPQPCCWRVVSVEAIEGRLGQGGSTATALASGGPTNAAGAGQHTRSRQPSAPKAVSSGRVRACILLGCRLLTLQLLLAIHTAGVTVAASEAAAGSAGADGATAAGAPSALGAGPSWVPSSTAAVGLGQIAFVDQSDFPFKEQRRTRQRPLRGPTAQQLPATAGAVGGSGDDGDISTAEQADIGQQPSGYEHSSSSSSSSSRRRSLAGEAGAPSNTEREAGDDQGPADGDDGGDYGGSDEGQEEGGGAEAAAAASPPVLPAAAPTVVLPGTSASLGPTNPTAAGAEQAPVLHSQPQPAATTAGNSAPPGSVAGASASAPGAAGHAGSSSGGDNSSSSRSNGGSATGSSTGSSVSWSSRHAGSEHRAPQGTVSMVGCQAPPRPLPDNLFEEWQCKEFRKVKYRACDKAGVLLANWLVSEGHACVVLMPHAHL